MAQDDAVDNLRVLFVCIGNSCRSPMAESILKSILTTENPSLNWFVDSAAIADWNVGLAPEDRCIEVLGEHGLSTDHVARQITEDDFREFDYIFGMDHMNISDLYDLAPQEKRANIELLGTFDYGQNEIIEDPYFEIGIHGFRKAFEQIQRSCTNFVKSKLQ